VVYLPPEVQAQAAGIGSNNCRVLADEVRRERISAQIEASCPSLFVISQAHYHPWKAFVDNQPTAIWKANYAYQAVLVPAGAHRVELRYEDRSFRFGSLLSAVSWLSCVVVLIRRRDPR